MHSINPEQLELPGAISPAADLPAAHFIAANVAGDAPAHALSLVQSSARLRRRRQKQQAAQALSAERSGIAASYARFSSEMQSEESIPDQQRKCGEQAEKNEQQILPQHEYSDSAISGTKLRRAGLDAMLAAAEAGEFGTLYFYSLSRLSRESVITMPMLKKLVHVLKIRVVSVIEGVDTQREGWELSASIIAVMHERFLADLSKSVLRGQEGTVLAGRSVGDYRFGYKSVPIPGSEASNKGHAAKPRMTYLIDVLAAPWVLRIFHWFVIERRTLRWIVRELNHRAAPKDHRASTPHWHHGLVTNMLQCPKYIGIWTWGQMQNSRDPFSGQVTQVPRSPEECEKWTRNFPYLRLISDEQFSQAQKLLEDNYHRHAAVRDAKGKLRGSSAGNAVPKRLLQGLVECAECKNNMILTGAEAAYLLCSNYPKGLCACKTQLPRALAERMILDQIGKRIGENPAWQEAVYAQLIQAWEQQAIQRPEELTGVEKSLGEIDRKIAMLVDSVESGTSDPSILERLDARRSERRELVKLRDQLARKPQAPVQRPSEQWLREQLQALGQTLGESTPAAAFALRELLDGQIVVTEVRREGRKRHFLRGTFRLKSRSVAYALISEQPAVASPGSSGGDHLSELITIDFVKPHPLDLQAAEAKRLYDQEWLHCDIAAHLKCGRSKLTKLLRHAFQMLNEPFPDGRSRRSELSKKHSSMGNSKSSGETIPRD